MSDRGRGVRSRGDRPPAGRPNAPQIATVGAREQDLNHERPYVEAVHEYADVAYGWALQDWIHPALSEVVESALLKLPLGPD